MMASNNNDFHSSSSTVPITAATFIWLARISTTLQGLLCGSLMIIAHTNICIQCVFFIYHMTQQHSWFVSIYALWRPSFISYIGSSFWFLCWPLYLSRSITLSYYTARDAPFLIASLGQYIYMIPKPTTAAKKGFLRLRRRRRWGSKQQNS